MCLCLMSNDILWVMETCEYYKCNLRGIFVALSVSYLTSYLKLVLINIWYTGPALIGRLFLVLNSDWSTHPKIQLRQGRPVCGQNRAHNKHLN